MVKTAQLFSKQSFLLITIAIAGFFLSLLAYWPGVMEWDSFVQYGQAIGILPLDDWHPPSLTLLWRALISIYNGPQPMLLLQSLFYWSGFLYLALRLWWDTSRFVLALAAVLVPFLPFLINFVGVIWKDVHLAVTLFWAALLLVFGVTSWSKLLISLLFIFYGLSVRHNGIAAALPLLILWSYRYLRFTDNSSKCCGFLVTCIIFLIYLVVNSGLNSLFSVKKTYPIKFQRLNEIVFIKCHSDSKNFGVLKRYYGRSLVRMAPQRRHKYLCDQVSSLASTDDTNIIYDQDILDKESVSKGTQILDLWTQSVRSHPLLYLDYRFRVYKTFLRPFSYPEPYYVWTGMDDENPLPIKLSFEIINPLGLNNLLENYVDFFAASKYIDLPFRPFFWLITLTATTLFGLHKRQGSVFLISASGFSYLILYFLVLPAPDFRYCYYSIFAQVLSIFLLLEQRVAPDEQVNPLLIDSSSSASSDSSRAG